MTGDPKVCQIRSTTRTAHALCKPTDLSLFQALQHVFHKSGYNYTKRTSSNFMNYMLSGPGIVIALGEPPT